MWPVVGEVITPYRNGNDPYAVGMHRGIDIAASLGSPVSSATAGTVTFAGKLPDGALDVTVRSSDGRFLASHMHLASVLVKRGQFVARGGAIGSVGRSGTPANTTPHLHFGVRLAEGGGYVDPLSLLGPLPVTPQPVPVPQPAAAVGQSALPSAKALEVPNSASVNQSQNNQSKMRANQHRRGGQRSSSQRRLEGHTFKHHQGVRQPVATPNQQFRGRSIAPQLSNDGKRLPLTRSHGQRAASTAAPGLGGASGGTKTARTRVKTRLELEPAQAPSIPAPHAFAVKHSAAKPGSSGSRTDASHLALLLAAIGLFSLLVFRGWRDG
ncbi:MAG: M23 family metallopeptidase, partial [Thermoleophilaceae bacterium]|nr:M23 family metallopeptidase [Thermoleophilaceae bacterium]